MGDVLPFCDGENGKIIAASVVSPHIVVERISQAVEELGFVLSRPINVLTAKRSRIARPSLLEFDSNRMIDLEWFFSNSVPDNLIAPNFVDDKIKRRLWALYDLFEMTAKTYGPRPYYRIVLLIVGDKGYTKVLEALKRMGVFVMVMYPLRSANASMVFASHLCDVFDHLFTRVNTFEWKLPRDQPAYTFGRGSTPYQLRNIGAGGGNSGFGRGAKPGFGGGGNSGFGRAANPSSQGAINSRSGSNQHHSRYIGPIENCKLKCSRDCELTPSSTASNPLPPPVPVPVFMITHPGS